MPTLIPIADLQGPQGPPGPAGSEGILKLFSPMDPLFGAVGDGITDDQAALEACWEAAGEQNGMVVIDRPYGFSGVLKHYGGMSVMQTALPKIKVTPTGPEPGLIAVDDGAQYQYGSFSDGSGSANDNPGPIRGLYVDGSNIAGGDNGLFVMDCAQSSLYDLMVSNSIGTGVNAGSSQNCNLFNIQVGGCAGPGVQLKALVPGNQGPGHILFFGGHIHDNYLGVLVSSNSSSDFFFPHDNYFVKTIIESGRVPSQAIRAAAVVESGLTLFDDVVFTFGAQVGPTNPVEEDCSILIDNPYYTAYPTVVNIRGGSIGGGPNGITDAIRIMQSGAANYLTLESDMAFANVSNKICSDGSILGFADPVIISDGRDRNITGSPAPLRLANDATKLNAYRKYWTGTVHELPTGFTSGTLQNPVTVKHADETAARYSINWEGEQRYVNPATGATVGRIFNNNNQYIGVSGGFGIGGALVRPNTIQNVAADDTATIDAATLSSYFFNFTATGADITSLTINNGTDGSELRIGMAGTGTNVITWPANVSFRSTAPQPVDGQVVFVTLIKIGTTWRELNRSN